MSVVGQVAGLSPVWVVSASASGVSSTVGAVSAIGAVSFPVVGGQYVMRFDGGWVSVSQVPDFTTDRVFSVVAWVKPVKRTATQRIVIRKNGSTEVSLSVTPAGYAQARIASAVGSHSVTITGTTMITDDKWHLVVLRSQRDTGLFGGDGGGVNADLWVDNRVEKQGWIHPGYFIKDPVLTMTQPVWVGRSPDGTNALKGDVAMVSGHGGRLTDSMLKTLWDGRLENRKTTGWGIIF